MLTPDEKTDLDLLLAAARAIRENLRADAPEAVEDVIAEPPCGSQVTDKDGDVYERRLTGWWRYLREEGWVRLWGEWTFVRDYAPLRLTTDADRERVALPVDTAPDVDPDERQSHPGVLWDKIDALTEDVERLTRERDEAVRDVRTAERQTTEQQARYEALRADIADRYNTPSYVGMSRTGIRATLIGILARDDEWGRDE